MSPVATATAAPGDLRHERDRFVAFAFASADAFVEVDQDLNLTYAAGAMRWLIGHELRDDVIDNLLDYVAPHDQKLVTAACRMVTTQGRFGPLQIAFCRPHSTRAVQVEISGTYLPTVGGRIFVAVRARSPEQVALDKMRRVTAPDTQEEASQQFAETAVHVAEAARESGQSMNLTLFNLDGLAQLRKSLAADMAGELTADIEAQLGAYSLGPASVAKVGENDFGLLHRGEVNLDSLKEGLAACAEGYAEEGQGIDVRWQSWDITTVDLTEAELAKAVVHAIQKFSETKGEFTISDLSKGFGDLVSKMGPRIAELKKVIKERAFDLVYQPIIGLADREIHHHEALVRFRSKTGQTSPYETISFAEDIGLIAALDLAICGKAIDAVREVLAANGRLTLAVNLSGQSLETPIFVQRLHTLLRTAPAFRRNLMFEVTETSKISDLETTNNVLQSLRELGHQVSLDDFGAGASAFQYLRAMSIDYVKIDGSYIRNLTRDAEKAAFVRSMTALCSDLGIETIGEMVEDEATAAALLEAGVIYGQGYLFGKPSGKRPR